jgi:hypothetical protein
LGQLILRPHYWEKTEHGLHLVQRVPAPRGASESQQELVATKVVAR